MEHRRYKETGKGTFYGEYVYDRTIPEGHFLRKLNEIMDWERFSQKLIELYKGNGQYGRPPFEPVLLLKMLLLAYLYNLSERQTETYVNDSMSAKYFLGLALDEGAPDHSTLTRFKERLIRNRTILQFEALLKEIVQAAIARGVEFGSVQILDSTHSVADVNTSKDESRKKGGKEPRDPDAHWGVKHSRKVRDEEGKTHHQMEYFHGYKAHMSLNAKNGLITALTATSGSEFDGNQLPPLLQQDEEMGVEYDTVSADRAYDDGNHHCLLQQKGLHSAIHLKSNRIHKKDANKQIWIEMQSTPQYQQGLKERYKIERKFGEAKRFHGLGRCRYVGLTKYYLQAILTAIVLNLKRMVKILTGVNFGAIQSLRA
jgi:IS5 family transposase